MSEFDQYASEYERIHNRNLSVAAASTDFFVRQKVELISEFWKKHQIRPDATFLDFGCGIGRTLRPLKEKFPECRYTGIDLSAESIRIASSQLKPGDATACFQTYSGEKLPFNDGEFDVVFLACVLHHVPPANRPALYAELKRIIRPGGHLIIFEHNPWNPLTRYIVATCEFDDDAILLWANPLRRALKKAGFTDLGKQYIIFLPGSLRDKLPGLEEKLTWCPLGGQYWVVARK